jgi:hypothetical protein
MRRLIPGLTHLEGHILPMVCMTSGKDDSPQELVFMRYIRRMQKKKDNRSVVQAVVAPELFRWVDGRAKKEGLSISAWLRRLVIQARDKAKS